MINAILRLRRDNDYNYAKIKDTFIPANGEICLVDTARDGLRAVCGDGVHTFGQLEFLGDFIKKGYYKDGVFYEEAAYINKIEGLTTRLYIDLHTNQFYHYDGISYNRVGEFLTATEDIAGVVKLYNTVGENTDGTMTQKAITDELNTKIELSLNKEDELIIFSL